MVSSSTGKKPTVAPYSGAMLAMVARLATGIPPRPGPWNSTNLPTTPWRAQQLGHPQHQVGGRRALGQGPVEAKPDHLGEQHHDRLAHHGGFGLDAAHAPAEHAEPVDHRGVRVGSDQRVGEQPGRPRPRRTLARYSRFTWWTMPVAGGHHPEPVEGGLAPLEELVALAIADELVIAVDPQRQRRGEGIDLHRVIDDEVARDQGVDQAGTAVVAGQADDGGAHRRQVDHHRHPGEVLEHHAARPERHLGLGHLGGVVGGQGGHVGIAHHVAIVGAQHRLEQHLDRVGKAVDVAMVPQGIEAKHLASAQRGVDRGAGAKGIVGHRNESLRVPLFEA